MSTLQKLRRGLQAAKRKIVVFTDIDLTQRWNKDCVSEENEKGIRKFRENGGYLIPITGAPFAHIPDVLRGPISLSEAGAVASFGNADRTILAAPEEVWAIEELRLRLGIGSDGGWHCFQGAWAWSEGPRCATITLLTGEHRYTLGRGRGELSSLDYLERLIADLIQEFRYPLKVRTGTASQYQWVDVLTGFEKHHAVELFLSMLEAAKVYYLGDGANDLEAMRLPGVVPVGFQNSIPAVQKVVRERGGMYVNQNGPDGGAAQALYEIMGNF